MRNESDVRDEVHALWAAVFGEPPILEAPADVLIATLVESLPKADYAILERFGVAAPVGDHGPPAYSPAMLSGPSSE